MIEKVPMSNDIKHFSIRILTSIEFGWQISKKIDELLPQSGKQCLVITEDFMLKLPFTKEIIQSLKAAGKKVQIYTDFEIEPDVASVDKAGALFNDESIGLIVAIGGGSTIDFAKSVSLSITEHNPIWDYVRFKGKVARTIDKQLTPVIAIPTTSGTGSEVTQYIVLSNRKLDLKATVVSPSVIPSIAIIDPSLTVSLPPEITAYTGSDVIAHAVESFLNFPNRTLFSTMLSLEAIRVASNNLVNAVANGSDRRARESMSWASLLGGLSISKAGTGIGHTLAQILGGQKHIPHGKTVALLLPAIVQLFEEEYNLSLIDLRQALGNNNQPAHEQVRAIWRKVSLPLTMKDLGIGEDYRQTLRQDTLANAGWEMDVNPVKLDSKDLDKILDYIY